MEMQSALQAPFEDPALALHHPTQNMPDLPELLAEIFSWLSKADLTRVARVCHLWSSLALDVIWQKIPELKYLINVYSPLIQWGLTTEGTRVWKFRDISGGGRWDVFWAYAQRVRTVEACNGLYTQEVIDHLKYTLQTSSCGPSLLPKLRSLSMRVLTDGLHVVETLPIIPAGLRTVHVSIELNVGSSIAQRLLKHLTAVPLDQLMDVEFGRHGRIDSDASLSVCRATFLQQNRSTLAHLNLSIFPLTSEDLEYIGSFPGVTKLVLKQRGTSIQLGKFFEAIGASFSSLRSIQVTLDGTIRDEVSIAVIEGLAPCRELQTIDLVSRRWKALTEENVRELGRRWPVMEEFYLRQGDFFADPVATPLGILQDFAQVWPRTLRKIAMTFDTAAPLPGSSSVRFKFDKLETMGVGWSLLHERNVNDAAEFLKAVSTRPLHIWGGKDGRWGLVTDRVNAALAA